MVLVHAHKRGINNSGAHTIMHARIERRHILLLLLLLLLLLINGNLRENDKKREPGD